MSASLPKGDIWRHSFIPRRLGRTLLPCLSIQNQPARLSLGRHRSRYQDISRCSRSLCDPAVFALLEGCRCAGKLVSLWFFGENGSQKKRIRPGFCNPLRKEPSVLSGRHVSLGTSSARKHKFPWFLGVRDYEGIDGLPSLLGQLEPYRLLGLSLSYGCSFGSISIRGDVLDLQRDDIASTQFAIDS